jgi:WD40 repeat protein
MLLPEQLGSNDMIARFRAEAETVATLDHPAILPVYTAAVHCGVPFFTMKLATGGTLSSRRNNFRGHWRQIAQLVSTLADAVQFAHSRGVIHRDLKPGNILFDEADRAYISDFGLAKYTGASTSITHTLNLLGTPAYLAPEVIERGAQVATTASDVYGLGSVLYELLAQSAPFSADSFSALLKEVAETSAEPPHRRVPGVPQDLEIICLRCLAKDPADRFTSAGELAIELRRWLEGVPIVSRPVSSAERIWQWCRRRPALASLIAAFGLTLIVAGIAQWVTNRSLTHALATTRAAEADAQQKLQASLLSEGKLRSNSRMMGQRYETLDILERAARIAPTVEVRSGIASALTRSDLKLVRQLPGTFSDHTTTIDFSPGLDAYVMSLPDGGFALRSTSDGRILRQYASPTRSAPRQFRFSGDGRMLSVMFTDRSISFWSVEGEKPLWSIGADRGMAVAVALHPTDGSLVYGSDGGEIRRRDLSKGTERSLVNVGASIMSLGFDPVGKQLAVLREGAVELYDAVAGTLLWTRPDYPVPVPPVWSDDSRLLMTANRTRHSIGIRNAATGIVQQTLAGHTAFPMGAKFFPDGKRVVTLGYDSTLRLWDLATGRELVQAVMAPRGFTLSSDGRRLGAASNTDNPALFEWADESVFREFNGSIRVGSVPAGFDLNAHGDWLVTASMETIRRDDRPGFPVHATFWDTRREQEAASFQFRSSRDDRVTIAFDSNGSGIAYSIGTGGIWQRRLQISASGDIGLGEAIPVGPPMGRFLLCIEPNGDWIIQRLPEKTLAIWPKGNPTHEADLLANAPAAKGIVHVDRHHLISLDSTNGSLRLWSRQDGSTIGEVGSKWPASVAFSPRGDSMVVGTDQSYRVWKLPGLQPGPQWPVRGESPIKEFSFSPSGRYVAGELAGSAIEIRDGQSFGLLLRLEPPVDLEMTGLCWSPDESRIYLRFRGPRIFCWDLPVLRNELAKRGLNW